MITIDKAATYLATSINKYDPSSSTAVMKYIIKVLINLIVIVSSVLIVAALTGHFIAALSCVWAFPLLRHISGGMHFKSNAFCNVVTCGFILTAIYFPINYWNAGLFINIIAVLILLFCAPNG